MKKFSKYYMLAALLVAGAAFEACTNDDEIIASSDMQKVYTMTVDAVSGANTRSLTESDGALTAAWNADDEVVVYNADGDSVGTLKPVEAGATKLKGTVSDVEVGDELTLKFLPDVSYAEQDGTLEYIDTHCNTAIATVEVTKIEGTDVYTSDADFKNQQSITKFTFSKTVSKVIISGGVHEITVTPTSASKTLYVAMPATDKKTDYIFSATVDGATYIGKKGAELSNGLFYTASVNLTGQTEYTNLSADASANTYMVTKTGKYMFRATVKGNGGLDPLTGTTATAIRGITGVKVLWELYGQGRAIKHDGTAYDISYSDGYVYFSTPEEFTPGDCCVAVYDSEGTILWSWLIWATPEVSTYNLEGYTSFMDRNLGAIDVGYCMRGFLYDWGRKDAFSAANGGYDVYPYVPVASSVFTHSVGPSTMEYAVAHPTDYIVGPSSYYTWMENTESTAKPWRTDVKTIYDPCPIGWRIPKKEEISGITGLPATGLTEGYDATYYYKGFGNPGTGYYWTSSTDEGSDQRAYAFCNDGRNIMHWGQDQGYAIRPVKE